MDAEDYLKKNTDSLRNTVVNDKKQTYRVTESLPVAIAIECFCNEFNNLHLFTQEVCH